MLPNAPTSSPNSSDGGKLWYPDYDTPWNYATCINDLPLPFGHGGRPTYKSKTACCTTAYKGQLSNACVCSLDDKPQICYTTVTTTVVSTIDLPNLLPTLPTNQNELDNYVASLENTIKALLQSGMGPAYV